MYQDLDITQTEYKSLEAETGQKAIYLYLKDFGGGESSICKVIDEYGSITNKNNPIEIIAKFLYNKLPSGRKMMIQGYLSEYRET